MYKYVYTDQTNKFRMPAFLIEVVENNVVIISAIAKKYKTHPDLGSGVSIIEVILTQPITNEPLKYLLLKSQSLCRSEFAGTKIYLTNNSSEIVDLAKRLKLNEEGDYFDISILKDIA